MCFTADMVGPIKTLTDLRRIEAAVRVTCNECGHVRMCDREALIQHRNRHRDSLDWDSVRGSLPCWNARCGSKNTRVEALPFSQDRIALRRKRAQTILMNLALSVLYEASYRSKDSPIATPEVRLALRVLYPFLHDQTDLRAYWDAASSPRDRPWEGCHNAYSRIVAALIKKDCAVDAELRR